MTRLSIFLVYRFSSFFSWLASGVRRPASVLSGLASGVRRLSFALTTLVATEGRPSSSSRVLFSPDWRPASGIRHLLQSGLASGVRRLASDLSGLASGVRRLASSSAAFTLVELMVVVAIIAILLMLLLPNIRTMREKAWTSHCQNNLRQYGIAMNQYMADYNGYFIFPGKGIGSGSSGYAEDQQGFKSDIPGGAYGRNVQAGSARDYWANMIPAYIPDVVTLDSLSGGNPSVRVCPMVSKQIKANGNFFDPDSPNFKGFRTVNIAGVDQDMADFEMRMEGGAGYDANNKLILDPAFTTYAINQLQLYNNKKDLPENVIAFIDWNAQEGWGATISYTNWMFNGTNSQGVVVVQDKTPKWTNAWWLTEVGFYHLQGSVYGANYVAMDGHVGWIGSNTISVTNFTTGL